MPGDQPVSEADLVYLADKLVAGDRLISLEERFRRAFEKHSHTPEAHDAVRRRLENALIIRERVQRILGFSPEEVLEKHSNTFRMLAAGHREVWMAVLANTGQPARFGR